MAYDLSIEKSAAAYEGYMKNMEKAIEYLQQ